MLYNIDKTVLLFQRNTYLYWIAPCSLRRAAHAGWRWRGWDCHRCCSSAPCCTCRSCWERPPKDSGFCSPQQRQSLQRVTKKLASFKVGVLCKAKNTATHTRSGLSSSTKTMQVEFLCVLRDRSQSFGKNAYSFRFLCMLMCSNNQKIALKNAHEETLTVDDCSRTETMMMRTICHFVLCAAKNNRQLQTHVGESKCDVHRVRCQH